MGTNYYLKINCCKECGRHDLVHIGKSSWGWAFLFTNTYPDKKKWKKVIDTSVGISIVDEYHHKISKKKFWAMVEERKDQQNMFTFKGERNRYEENPEQYEYIDPEGYRFAKQEFS